MLLHDLKVNLRTGHTGHKFQADHGHLEYLSSLHIREETLLILADPDIDLEKDLQHLIVCIS